MKKKAAALLAGCLVLCLLASSGCGKDKKTKKQTDDNNKVTIETSQDSKNTDDVVSMEKNSSTDISKITNIMGTKATSSSALVISNKTGFDIKEIYVRPSGEEDWGKDLVQGKFVLKNLDKAVYYYERGSGQDEKWDIQVLYTDEDESACWFRELNFTHMNEISLCMEEGVPYATYFDTSSKKEISTLKDAKKRMGLDSDEKTTPTPEPKVTSTPVPEATKTPDPTATPTPDEIEEGKQQQGAHDDLTNQGQDLKSKAEAYIGEDLSSLTAACGDANSSTYEEDPDYGEIGYHFYDDFTVSTSNVDGKEVVTGVW